MADPGSDSVLIDSLRDPRRFGARVRAVQLIETHISWVLLTGEYAYKIKKPVELAFLDFSTLDKRKHFCEEELRINRRLAPEIYVGLVTIGGTPDEPVLGAEPAIEYAVKMRQFSPDATLEREIAAGKVSPASVRRLAELIADFHGAEAPTEGELGDRVALANAAELAEALGGRQNGRLEALRRWTEAQCVSLRDALRSRRAHGAIKECHGDLHLGNLVMIGERIVPFDALEFDRSLRCIDVMSEVGFLVMDLLAHARADLAFEFLNRYLEKTGDYDGLRVLRFYIVYRALVRAKVRAIALAQHPNGAGMPAGPPYLAVAADSIRAPQPVLIITHGLSGSGKTTFTDALIGALPAVRIRSDLERKRLHGLAPAAHSGSGIAQDLYSDAATARTYTALAAGAASGLGAGFDMIVDATFLSRERRAQFHALARRHGAAFVILSLEAGEDALRRRIAERARRAADASEADTAVLDYQIAHREPLTDGETQHRVSVDTEAPFDCAQLAATLRARSARG